MTQHAPKPKKPIRYATQTPVKRDEDGVVVKTRTTWHPGHTPGPWKAIKGETASSAWYVVQATKPRRNRLIAPCGDEPIGKANARLIAKAPEMYTLLQEESYGNGQMSAEWHRKRFALLREIEGEPHDVP